MNRIKAGLFALAIVCGLIGAAEAYPTAGIVHGTASSNLPSEEAQFGGGGRCFYRDGWHGPGFYRCGFRFRRGLGFLGGGGGSRVERGFRDRRDFHDRDFRR